jgi:tetratricopeptide (TPR) repeat protein
MARKEDPAFEITFYESVLRRDPRYADVVEILGGLYTKTGRIADGLRMDRKLVRLQPDNATAHYNLGCSLALVKRNSDALRALRRAIELGYNDHGWMEEDPDLAGLQKSPKFRALLAGLKTPG